MSSQKKEPLFPLNHPSLEQIELLHSCNLKSFPKELAWLSEVTQIDCISSSKLSLGKNRLIQSRDTQGDSASPPYFLIDDQKRPLAIIKPADEEPGTEYGSKLPGLRRAGILPGGSVLREVLSYFLARSLGLSSIPATLRIYLHSDLFLGDQKTKLVSIQKYLPNAENWTKAAQFENELSPQSLREALRLHYLTNNSDGHSQNILITPKEKDVTGKIPLYIIDNGLTFSGLESSGKSALMAEASLGAHYPFPKFDVAAFKESVALTFPDIALDHHMVRSLHLLEISLNIEEELLSSGYSPFFIAGLLINVNQTGFPPTDFLKQLFIACDKDIPKFREASSRWIGAMIASEGKAYRYFETSSEEVQAKLRTQLHEHPEISPFASIPSLSIRTMAEVLEDQGPHLEKEALMSELSQRIIEKLVLGLTYQKILESENEKDHRRLSIRALCRPRLGGFLPSEGIYNPQTIQLNLHHQVFRKLLRAYGWDWDNNIPFYESETQARQALQKLHERACLIAKRLENELHQEKKQLSPEDIEFRVYETLIEGASLSEIEFKQYVESTYL